MKLFHVGVHPMSQLMGVQVGPQNLKNLSQQLLLVQIVQLEGGVHFVNDGVLVDKFGENIHDSNNQSS
jgi:hypothetical protein